MRHKVRGRKLSRERDQRRLMFRNLLISLVEHERIATTLIKAKELRSIAERVITYGKKGEVHHRRLTYGILQDRTMVKKVFDELAPRYNEVNGGYT
ncbi:MAG: 50S ribosomal protein L17, partial [Candidatus Cloacimonetes bacterium]|nr:50S ribosomal protein L17 [Candidatus Cloacimonadota bacterium]